MMNFLSGSMTSHKGIYTSSNDWNEAEQKGRSSSTDWFCEKTSFVKLGKKSFHSL